MDLALDEQTWDLLEVDGDLVQLNQEDSIRQFLRQRYGLFLGEWFLDSSEGVPYLQSVFIKGAQLAVLDAIFKRVATETIGIEELMEFLLDFDAQTRTFTIELKARSTAGVIEYSEEIEV